MMDSKTSPFPKSSDFPTLAHDIIRESIAAVHPVNVVARQVRRVDDRLFIHEDVYDLKKYRRVHIISAGKGAVPFYEGLAPLVDDRLVGGVIVAPPGQVPWDDRLIVRHGSHPIPDQQSLLAGQEVCGYIDSAIQEDDLVFVLITGGASALMENPVPGIAIEDIALINRLLLAGGADITEINAVRITLSAIKGGGLARRLAPAATVTLMISDIVDSPLQHIGSGPTVISERPFERAAQILGKYGLMDRLPQHLRNFVTEKKTDKLPGNPPAENRHYLLADNHTLLEAALEAAKKRDIPTVITSTSERNDASRHARDTAQTLRSITIAGDLPRPPVLLISGGELTVTVKGNGLGGRNQEFILALLRELRDYDHPFFAASIGTDGIDGITDAAGAWIDENTLARAARIGLDPATFLQNNDSFHFFAPLGQLIFTGPTGANCMDLRLVYIPQSE